MTVGPKQTMGRTVEQVRLEIPMPKSVLNCSLLASQVGASLGKTIGRTVEQVRLEIPMPKSVLQPSSQPGRC
jgi:hypothetical protein